MASYGASSPEAVSTAVAIDKDRNSQHAVRWAVENLGLKEKLIILVHVTTPQNSQSKDCESRQPIYSEMQQLFLPCRGFCARKGVRTKEVILHDTNIAVALSEFITANSITNIVLGASRGNAITRAFKNSDVATSVGKSAPDFCSVYVVSKGKAQKIKSPTEPISPNTATISIPNNVFSPAVSAISLNSSREGSLRSATSELSSSDGGFSHSIRSSDSSKNASPLMSSQHNSREYQQGISTERPFGSSAPSSLYSVSSSESIDFFPWEKRHGNNIPTPPESACTSFDSTTFGSRCNSQENSVAGDGYFGHMTREGKIAALQQYVNHLNLPGRAPEDRPHYLLDSSDPSELQSYASDISYEPLDEPTISDSSRCSTASLQAAELDEELKRMKLELKQIAEKYNAASQKAEIAREKVRDIAHWRSDDASKIADAKHTEDAALAIVEMEKQKCKTAIEIAQKAQIMAEFESEKRKRAERKFKIESKEKQQVLGALARSSVQYRRYSIDEIEAATNYFSSSDKIGEGSYGPVYKATIDHTPVAIKVLRSDKPEGLKQFQQEVEVLSQMRHPNMVLLLGACPEYGCLVYEYMENGCLEDRLFCKDGTPSLPWTTRFAIAAEIATALNFLHQRKPQPLVHRDLKPANILLDKNYISKISDVGLSRLVPPPAADNFTQYHVTSAAGTFCYIDPEYQQTGLLGTKSDIYSLGIILLQIITARPPMGLTFQVKKAIETGRFVEILDQRVRDWPVEGTLSLAKLALKCSELRRRDRPRLDSVILPELERLRDVGSKLKPERRLYRYTYSRCPSFEESSTSSHQEICDSYGMQIED